MSSLSSRNLSTHIDEAIADWIDANRDGAAPIEEVIAALAASSRRLILRLNPDEQIAATKCAVGAVIGEYDGGRDGRFVN